MKTFIIKNTIKTANFLLIALRQYLQSLNAKKEKTIGNQRERKTSQLSTNGTEIKLAMPTSFNSIIFLSLSLDLSFSLSLVAFYICIIWYIPQGILLAVAAAYQMGHEICFGHDMTAIWNAVCLLTC